MNCAFCGKPYASNIGCCDKAAMSIALIALKYHTECEHDEVRDAINQLQNRLEPNKIGDFVYVHHG